MEWNCIIVGIESVYARLGFLSTKTMIISRLLKRYYIEHFQPLEYLQHLVVFLLLKLKI